MSFASLLFTLLLLSQTVVGDAASVEPASQETARQDCILAGLSNVVGEIGRCSWHDWTMEYKFQNQVCEPSESWLREFITVDTATELVDACANKSKATCLVNLDEYERCETDTNSSNCFTPALWVLHSLLFSLTATYPELDDVALKLPTQCAQYVNSSHCDSFPGCRWDSLDVDEELLRLVIELNQTVEIFTGDTTSSTYVPCLVNETFREMKMLELGVRASGVNSLKDLDKSMRYCATDLSGEFNLSNETICEQKNIIAQEDSANRITEECAWRGDKPKTDQFSWSNLSYPGKENGVINSGCTVSRFIVAEKILDMFLFDSEPLNITEEELELSDEIKGNLALLLLQEASCQGDTIVTTVKEELRVWEILITQTVYLCALTYLAAGLRLVWVTRKEFRDWRLSSVMNTAIICFSSMFTGGIMGFILAAIPSYILTWLIAGEADRVVVFSLGYVQGIVILYFDFGRAIV